MLGLWLIEQDLITEKALDHALRTQMESGGRLGDILISHGAITPLTLYKAIALQINLPFVDLLKTNWGRGLLQPSALNDYIQLRMLPLEWLGNSDEIGNPIIATSEPFDRKVIAYAKKHYGENVQLVVTSPIDIRRSIEQHFTEALTHQSQYRLAHIAPERSALRTTTIAQRASLWALFLFYTSCFIFFPYHTAGLSLFCINILYALALAFKALVFAAGLKPPHFDAPVSPISDMELPTYSILVPLYREAENVAALLASLAMIDYPKHKLDIKLVLEADDEETIRAAMHLKPSYQFEIIRVPPSKPRTKPKACNYALAFARGDIITIYDVEDRPDPAQLRLVAHLFDALPSEVSCVQAKLRYDNAHENLLTRWFDMEYAVLFEHLLLGLERLNMPIPLGGTSNHVNAERLYEVGEWDPFNVTEDADLGMRLAALGFKTRTIPSTTMEEAPISLGAWVAQRSRWIKGHMQTWLVHMRSPIKLYRTLGLHGFLGFQMFIGLPNLLFLTAPIVLILSILWTHGLFNDVMPSMLGTLMYINLIAYFTLHWLQAFCVAHTLVIPRGERRPAFMLKAYAAALLFPMYWLLHIITSFIALHQLILRPHHWSKTTHGVSVMRSYK
jgi:cellulose synthase/poly-beta-1,6-N-acetylglucosamine synthase-like glycosyltransferase